MRYPFNHGDLMGFLVYEGWLLIQSSEIDEMQFLRSQGLLRARMRDGTIREARATEEDAEFLVNLPENDIDHGFRGLPTWEAVEAKTSLERFLEDGEGFPVVSSNVASLRYDARNKLLTIEFTHGGLYDWDGSGRGVERSEAAALADAASKGGYVWDHLYGSHVRGPYGAYPYKHKGRSGVRGRNPQTAKGKKRRKGS